MSQDNLSSLSKPQRSKKKCSICPHESAPGNWNRHWLTQHPGEEEKRELKEGESVREPDFQFKTGKFVNGDDESRRSKLGSLKKNQKPDLESISAANHVNKRQRLDSEYSFDLHN